MDLIGFDWGYIIIGNLVGMYLSGWFLSSDGGMNGV
jgi:hypothetical protein